MEDLIGSFVSVYMKNGKSISGMLFKLQDNYIYVKADNKVIVIPDNNINFYSTEIEKTHDEPTGQIVENRPKNILSVSINGAHLVDIPVPPNVDLSVVNDGILTTIWSNLNVQDALRGKMHKALDYSPGAANIIVSDIPNNTSDTNNTISDNNSFSMEGGKNPMDDYLSGAEMIEKFKNHRKKETKNE